MIRVFQAAADDCRRKQKANAEPLEEEIDELAAEIISIRNSRIRYATRIGVNLPLDSIEERIESIRRRFAPIPLEVERNLRSLIENGSTIDVHDPDIGL